MTGCKFSNPTGLRCGDELGNACWGIAAWPTSTTCSAICVSCVTLPNITFSHAEENCWAAGRGAGRWSLQLFCWSGPINLYIHLFIAVHDLVLLVGRSTKGTCPIQQQGIDLSMQLYATSYRSGPCTARMRRARARARGVRGRGDATRTAGVRIDSHRPTNLSREFTHHVPVEQSAMRTSAIFAAFVVVSTSFTGVGAQAPACDLATLFSHLSDIQTMCCTDGNECSSSYPGEDDGCSTECGEMFEPFWESACGALDQSVSVNELVAFFGLLRCCSFVIRLRRHAHRHGRRRH